MHVAHDVPAALFQNSVHVPIHFRQIIQPHMHTVGGIYHVVFPVLNPLHFHGVRLHKADIQAHFFRFLFCSRQLLFRYITGRHPGAQPRKGKHGMIVPTGRHTDFLPLQIRKTTLYLLPCAFFKGLSRVFSDSFQHLFIVLESKISRRIIIPVLPVFIDGILHNDHPLSRKDGITKSSNGQQNLPEDGFRFFPHVFTSSPYKRPLEPVARKYRPYVRLSPSME